MAAQMASQTMSQQVWSSAQTVSQQSRSLQLELLWGTQQLPASGAPHTGSGHASAHAGFWFALDAQKSSHWTSQQKMSRLQIASQQAASLHHGVSRGLQQSPAQGDPQPNW